VTGASPKGSGSGFVMVAEQGQTTGHQFGGAILIGAVEAGNVVVDQLGRGGVVADDDEA
jgi:hypothetical protein